MQTALQFFHKRLPRWISLSLDEIVEDRYPARLQDLPPGDCEVKVLVLDPARPEGDRILGKPKVLGRVSIEPAKK